MLRGERRTCGWRRMVDGHRHISIIKARYAWFGAQRRPHHAWARTDTTRRAAQAQPPRHDVLGKEEEVRGLAF